MAKIKLAITDLKNNEKSIEQHIAQLEALNSRLEVLLTRIESSWEGDSSVAYIRGMRNYAAQAANMVSVFSEFKSYVNSATSTFETLDNSGASRINGAF